MAWMDDSFTKQILAELNVNRMMRDAAVFSQWERYSGTPHGEAAVDYIVEQMTEADVLTERLRYDFYRSLPISGTVTILSPTPFKIEAVPVVYSGEAGALRGELIFDSLSLQNNLNTEEKNKRYASFQGKIVLTYDFDFDFYYDAARAGALGIIAIWPKDIHHHDTIGGVWGTPAIRDRDMYPLLPYVEIIEPEARVIFEMMERGPISVQMDVSMDDRVITSSMPVATIKGESDKFVLVSGHYDSWHEGMTDNGAANVLMMELARALQKNCGLLKRSVVLAWWSGHSDGRYSGSTWYCDHYWKSLHDNCVAHINMDICGCRGSNAVRLDMSGMEGTRFNDDFLSQYNSRPPLPYKSLNRSSDQSFWGVRVPVSIAPQFYIDGEGSSEQGNFPASVFGADGPFFWWHTKEDSLDKVSEEVLMRDCRIAAQLTCRYSNSETLPADLVGFVDEMKKCFQAFSTQTADAFDITPLLPLIEKLENEILRLMEALPGKADTDDIIIKVAGELARLKFTCSSPYYHDRAVPHPPYAAFANAALLSNETLSEKDRLFAQADFIRQRNRMVGQLSHVMDEIDYQLLKWNLVKN